jgi:predicted nucleic acid-binding protein
VTTSGPDVAYYLDTSALVKLVVAEDETDALIGWLDETDGDWVSSDLARTELVRAVRRTTPDRVVRAREVLDSVTLLDITTQIYEEAARIDPFELRTLDSLHLAVALDLGDELESIVTYDDRLAEAATVNGVLVTAPT